MAASHTLEFVQRILSPVLVLISALYNISARAPPAIQSSPSQITSLVVKTCIPRRSLILSSLSLVSLSFLADGLSSVVFAVYHKYWDKYTALEVNAILGIVAYGGLAVLGVYKAARDVNVWSFASIRVTIVLALALDIALVASLGLSFEGVSLSAVLHIAFPTLRVLCLVPLVYALYNPLVLYLPVPQSEGIIEPAPTASSSLLDPAYSRSSTGVSTPVNQYGTFESDPSSTTTSSLTIAATLVETTDKPEEEDGNEDDNEILSWKQFGRRSLDAALFSWPSKDRYLQFRACICMLLLIAGRALNVLVPFTFGQIIRTLEDQSDRSVWPYLLAYMVLYFLQRGGLDTFRNILWDPIKLYSSRELSQKGFEHIMNLSLSFHIRKKTGEVLRTLELGEAVTQTFDFLFFRIVPAFVDVLIALVAFAVLFEWALTVTIFGVMFTHVGASIIIIQSRNKIRRQMNDSDSDTRAIRTDCLFNYETVKFFCGEQYEKERYGVAFKTFQSFEYRLSLSYILLSVVQNLITMFGLLVGSIIVASRVVDGRAQASDFVIFITYLGQVYSPLLVITGLYKMVNQNLVDAEKLFKLLGQPTEIDDKPNAPDLVVGDGEIEFDNVKFSYNNRSLALNGISFKVPKRSSVALVGDSGSGKSTILRLLYRFYNLEEGQGRILIDGQNIRDVTQASLRKAIGVVPQDSVLFNGGIGYNIGYGKIGCSQEEIVNAAKAAQIHERILTFPDGYETKVGERGVRLSGGEKQRVSIARTLLKNPPILLLDEATSALDSSTEKDIQTSLESLSKGRSSLTIAHRLSTIANADLIIVLKDGQIIETGTHSELLALNGVFATMWSHQVSSSSGQAST